MNPQLLGLLSQRLNLSPEESALLGRGQYAAFATQRMASDPSLGGDPLMSALLSSMPPETAETEPLEEIVDAAEARDARDARVEVSDGAEIALRYVAQVLGACSCFGENARCPRCRGDGAPGYFRSSDPETLIAWAQPGLHRLGLRITRASSRTNTKKKEG